MDKRAQGLPITTIILAILGLVVLVLLYAMVTGRMTFFGRGVSECPGVCVTTNPAAQALPSAKLVYGQADVKCEDYEKELAGFFIAANQAKETKSADLVRCDKCCVATA
ncbi:MAG: hypothetical protein QXM31_02915 [Candidatus Woesearchaeota archaeon]